MNAVLKLILCLISFMTLTANEIAISQEESSKNQRSVRDLKSKIDRHIRKILSHHFSDHEFETIIDITLSNSQDKKTPYLVNSVAAYDQKSIKNINLKLFLSRDLNQSNEQSLIRILYAKSPLNQNRGDKISIENFSFKVENSNAASLEKSQQSAINQAQQNTRDIKARHEQLARERDDIQRELVATKTQLTEISDQLRQQKNQTKTVTTSWLDNLKQQTAGVLASILGLVAILVSAFLLSKSFGKIGTGFESGLSGVASGLSSIGNNLGQNEYGIDTSHTGQQDSQQTTTSPTASPNQDLGVSDNMNKRLIELHELLVSAMTETTESLAIQYLSRLIQDQNSIDRAVVTMELLGKDLANKLYQRLSQPAQSAVLNFMAFPRYSAPKLIMMLEAGEELKTALLSDGFSQVRADLNPALLERLAQIDDEDLFHIIDTLDQKYISRLFIYFEPTRLARIISYYQKPGEKSDQVLNAITKMPESRSDQSLDPPIQEAIEAYLVEASSDTTKPLLGYYRSLLQNIQPEIGERLAEAMSESNSVMKNFIDENYITRSTFFNLRDEIQESILENLTIKNLGGFILGLNENQRDLIKTKLDPGRSELIDEEIDQYESITERQRNTIHWQSTNAIIKMIEKEKGYGSIKDILRESDPELRAVG